MNILDNTNQNNIDQNNIDPRDAIIKSLHDNYADKLQRVVRWNVNFLCYDNEYASIVAYEYSKIIAFFNIIDNIHTIFTDEIHTVMYGNKKEGILKFLSTINKANNNYAYIANKNLYKKIEETINPEECKLKYETLQKTIIDIKKLFFASLKMIVNYGNKTDYDYVFMTQILCIDLHDLSI